MLVIDWQEIEEVTNPAEISIKRFKATEVVPVMWPASSKQEKRFRFPVAVGDLKQDKVKRPRTKSSSSTSPAEPEARGDPELFQDTLHEKDKWTITRSAIILHHYKPRQYLYTPDPADLPIPIEFIDVGRRTETNLEDQEEALIEDIWYASDPRYLTAPWTGRTIFPLRHLKPPKNMEYCNGEFVMPKKGSD